MSNEDTNSLSDQTRPTKARYIVLVGLCLVAGIAYLSRNYGISIAEKSVREDLRITDQQLGQVLGAFYITYAFFQIPGGWLGKIWGSRVALPIFAAISSVATLLIGFANSFAMLITLRLVIGAAQAGLFPSAAGTISKWFPISQRAMASGSMASFMSLGGASAAALAGVLLDSMTWRSVFIIFSIPGLLWAAWFALWFRSRPEQHKSVNDLELNIIRQNPIDESPPEITADEIVEQESAARTLTQPDEPTPWGAMAVSLPMWLICGQQFFRAAGFIFFPTWFPKFLKETWGVTQMESGLLSSMPLLATVAGCLFGGFLIDQIFRMTASRRMSRQVVAIAFLSLCSILIFLANFAPNAQTAVLMISVGVFCSGIAGPAAYTTTMDMAGDHVPLVFSTMNMSGNIAAAICPMVVPWIVKTSGNWNLVLFFFAAIYLAGAVCWAFLNPNGTITAKHDRS